MAQVYYTPVRRNHVIGPAGPGSMLVTRSGVTVMICGLQMWVDVIPAKGADETARRVDREGWIKSHELHDHNLERELQVKRFLVPPVVDEEPSYARTWFLPSIRFPLAEYCHNPTCRRLGKASPEDPSVGKCPHCAQKFASRRQQVPIVLICPSGHIDEVDWSTLVHPTGECDQGVALTYHINNVVTAPEIRCTSCKSRARLDPREPRKCSGRRPWIVGASPEDCTNNMIVADRTSTTVYFPTVRSSLHIPAQSGLRDAVIRWLEDDPVALALRMVPGIDALRSLLERGGRLFEDLTEDSLAEHVQYLDTARPQMGLREQELTALTSGRRAHYTSDGPPILDAETLKIGLFDEKIAGPKSLISRVVAVHRLSETRALAGFSRVEPRPRTESGVEGFATLWGHKPGESSHSHDWLPGMRVFGEGLLIELNPERVARWEEQVGDRIASITLQGETLTPRFQLGHTLAHLLINAASLQCGYPVASLRDRIYATDDRLAVLIYTAAGDSIGTLGGLVELSQPQALEAVLNQAFARARWCPLDPVCLQPVTHIRHDQAGACHQCCYLPETSCDWWNQGLDRATLVGRGELKGFLFSP